MKDRGLRFDIRRYAVHDGPGIRTTVFFKGCPLHCLWCHNPEGITPGIQKAVRQRKLNGRSYSYEEEIGRWLSSAQVMEELLKDQLFYEESGGGVTFSGGEPLSQSAFLLKMLSETRRFGLHTAVDTSGFADADIFQAVASLTHCLLFDLKTTDQDKHMEYTGVDTEQIVNNLKSLPPDGPDLFVRIPVIPGINASVGEMMAIGQLLCTLDARVKRVDLLPYHRLGRQKYACLGQKYPGDFGQLCGHDMKEFEKVFTNAGFAVKTGG